MCVDVGLHATVEVAGDSDVDGLVVVIADDVSVGFSLVDFRWFHGAVVVYPQTVHSAIFVCMTVVVAAVDNALLALVR